MSGYKEKYAGGVDSIKRRFEEEKIPASIDFQVSKHDFIYD
jgi:hypothetical protein